jgi:hypothetical protein
MTKYARKKVGCWIDVYTVPEQFADVETLARFLPGDESVQVGDEAKHGDFVVGVGGLKTRAIPEPAARSVPRRTWKKFLSVSTPSIVSSLILRCA